jgi:hypothetical protein
MCGDALEFPCCRFFRLVGYDMVDDHVVCDDLFRLSIINGKKEFDSGWDCLLFPLHDLQLLQRYVPEVVVHLPAVGPSGMSYQ